MRHITRSASLLLLAFALLATACGGKSYGSNSLASQVSPGGGSYSLAIPSPTPSPGEASISQPNQQPQQQQTPPPPPPAPAAQSVTVKIQNDSTGQYFNPAGLGIGHGTIVVFLNTDSVARSVTTESGPASFNSGSIAPGKSWSYTFAAAGTYQIQDGTRPYATLEIRVA